MPVELLDRRLDEFDCVFKSFKAVGLLGRGCRDDVQRRRDEIDLDRNFFSGSFKTGEKSLLNGINAFVTIAGALDVGADLHRLRRELPLDVRQQNILRVLVKIAFVEQRRLKHSLLENVIRSGFVLVFLLEVPGSLLVELLELLI